VTWRPRERDAPTGLGAAARSVIYTLEPGLGGVLTMVDAVARLHVRLGLDVSLVYTTPGRVPAGRYRRLRHLLDARPRWEATHGLRGFAIPAWPLPVWLAYALPLACAWRVIRRSQIHVVVSGSNHCGLPAALLRNRYVVWIATLYEDELAAKANAGDRWAQRILRSPARRLLARQERLVFERAALILANGAYAANSVRRAYPHVADRLRMLTHPVDLALFHPDPDARRRADARYLLYTGRINDPRKNMGMLIRAFARVRATAPDLRLVLAGEPPAPDLGRAVIEAGLGDAVRFVGHQSVPELVDLYQGAELFVLPSLQEGLGISMLEALACGVPAVATRCGGPEAVLDDGVTGRLVPNDDPDALAAAILDLLADPARLASMRERCETFAAQTFASGRAEAALLDAFRSVYPEHFPGR
jgi:glycosyltransferase involved in cell wall biosynthesis